MKDVLWISLIGASLVFLGLVFLWLMMDLLVHATNEKKKKSIKDSHENDASDIDLENDLECKQKAAAASIAVSLALRNTSFLSTRFNNNQGLSAWQISHRNQQIHNRVALRIKNRNTK